MTDINTLFEKGMKGELTLSDNEKYNQDQILNHMIKKQINESERETIEYIEEQTKDNISDVLTCIKNKEKKEGFGVSK